MSIWRIIRGKGPLTIAYIVVLVVCTLIMYHSVGDWSNLNRGLSSARTPLGLRHYQQRDLQQSDLNTHNSDHMFVISIWLVGEQQSRRFLRSYGTKNRDPFEYCSVRNCRLETNDSKVAQSDAVVFHMHKMRGPTNVPSVRSPKQLWIFFTDESPRNTFLLTKQYTMKDYNGLFNLSMTYRSDADVWVPYGRTVTLSEPLDIVENIAKKKTKFVAIMGSNCGSSSNKRWKLVHKMQEFIQVDIYGGCGPFKNACPGHFTKDCDVLLPYKFYLSFENSNCREYMTEKVWWNAYAKEAVPVIMGSSKAECERLLPPKSYIHVDDFKSVEELTKQLQLLDKDDDAYNAYHDWRRNYKVLNEHGYFGTPSLHLCRICEALHKTWVHKTYNDLDNYWSVKDCQTASPIVNDL